MKPKERGNRPPKRNSSGGTRRQQTIAAVIGKNSPARQAYDSRGIRPTVAEMQAERIPGMEQAGRIVLGLMQYGGTEEPKVEAVTSHFCRNHEDIVSSLAKASGVAVGIE